MPPRVAGVAGADPVSVNTSAWKVVRSVDIHAPTDGHLMVVAATSLGVTVPGPIAQVSMNVNRTTPDPDLESYFAAFDEVFEQARTLTKVYPVSAGTHTVNLLGRRSSGTASIAFDAASISVLFVARGADGAF